MEAEGQDQVRVPVREERLELEKRPAELGAVEVRTTVETEQQTVPVELEREEVRVEQRDAKDRPAGEADLSGAFEEGTVRVPVRGEEAVARKAAVVTGEVVIDKARTTETQRVTDTLRKERVAVDEGYERHRAAYEQAFAGRKDRPAPPTLRRSPTSGSATGPGWRRAGPAAPGSRRRPTCGPAPAATPAGDAAWERLKREVREGFDRARGR